MSEASVRRLPAFGWRSALLLMLLLAGCRQEPARSRQFDPDTTVGRPACEARTFEGSRFTLCRFDAGKHELRLAWKGRDGHALRSFEALGRDLAGDATRLRFAMNGGMYDEQGAPIGLYVERGREMKRLNRNDGPGNFHLSPNGVFALDARGRVTVTPSAIFRAEVRDPVWATQSGPMLVIDGKLHPKFDANGESRLVRNGVGVQDAGTAYFVISEEGVSFGRFARFFRDSLHCANALYLDGSVSSLWDKGAGRQDMFGEIGPMIVVLDKLSR